MEHKGSGVNKSDKPRRKASGAAVLQPAVTEALHRALFEEWAETGFAALRMERIAARAGVGKAALYRRWKSKQALVMEAVRTLGGSISPVPNTGSLAGDVQQFTHRLAVVLRHPLVRRILPDLHAERIRSGELSELVDFVGRDRRSQAVAILDRAIARGELKADADRELALDLLIAPLYWRIVIQQRPASKQDIQRIAAVIIVSIQGAGA